MSHKIGEITSVIISISLFQKVNQPDDINYIFIKLKMLFICRVNIRVEYSIDLKIEMVA